jgi:hypothetical protein
LVFQLSKERELLKQRIEQLEQQVKSLNLANKEVSSIRVGCAITCSHVLFVIANDEEAT